MRHAGELVEVVRLAGELSQQSKHLVSHPGADDAPGKGTPGVLGTHETGDPCLAAQGLVIGLIQADDQSSIESFRFGFGWAAASRGGVGFFGLFIYVMYNRPAGWIREVSSISKHKLTFITTRNLPSAAAEACFSPKAYISRPITVSENLA